MSGIARNGQNAVQNVVMVTKADELCVQFMNSVILWYFYESFKSIFNYSFNFDEGFSFPLFSKSYSHHLTNYD